MHHLVKFEAIITM